MEGKAVFAQCALVLLMTLHDTSACPCSGMLRWEDIMCPNRDKTVVEGRVMGGQLVETIRNRNDPEDIAFCGGYTMYLERIFKNGSNPLGVRNGTFFMVFPYSETECGRPLYAGRTYIVAGGDIIASLGKLPGAPWAKYPGVIPPPGYYNCGPGTRLNEKDQPRLGECTINEIDQRS